MRKTAKARSLRNAPPLETLLSELVPFLSQQQETEAKIGKLLQCLRDSRCLVILDNMEAILQAGEPAGQYRPGYKEYGELLQILAETSHQSCLILTSREKPRELATFKGAVRSLQLSGSKEASLALIQAYELVGSEAQKHQLCTLYGGNPLAIKIVATLIQDLFDGKIELFLGQKTAVCKSIQELLEQQFKPLSSLEESIMYWLAINREWTKISQLTEDIIPAISGPDLLATLESLSGRSLIEKQAGSYSQQPVVMEYVTDLLIKEVFQEIKQASSSLTLFCSYPLIKATAEDYVRESQIRVILEPIAAQLQTNFSSSKALEQQLQKILKLLRDSETSLSGYGGGNLINLAHHLQIDLTGYDFSGLRIW